MKQKNYQRWSRWLFLTLLTLFVGVSPAWAQAKELPYSYGFEDNNLATDGWTKQNPGNNNSSKFIISTSAKQNGTYGFQFSSYDGGTANQLLVSPELNAPSGVVVSFAYKNSNAGSYYAETFKVGYSTLIQILQVLLGEILLTKVAEPGRYMKRRILRGQNI